MAISHDPLGKDQDGQSKVHADVREINADFRRDLAFATLTEEMVRRLHGYGREEIVPENVTLYTHGDRDSDMFAVLDGQTD
jgi:thioredoxin reductase (NADPH)